MIEPTKKHKSSLLFAFFSINLMITKFNTQSGTDLDIVQQKNSSAQSTNIATDMDIGSKNKKKNKSLIIQMPVRKTLA